MSKKKESQGKILPNINDDICCSFCGTKIEERDMAFAENDAIICNTCLEIYYHLLEFEKKENFAKTFLKPNIENISPKAIYDELDKYVVGQNNAKKILSVAVYNHYMRINSKEQLDKSNILMIGPTGVGKTLLAKTIAKTLNLPIAICDATVYTQAGYVGEDVENILLTLLQNADYDIEVAQKGIVFIDEIDKLARKGESVSITRDVSGEGVQNSLLKIIEGTIVNVPPQGGRKHPYQEFIKFDTSDILFICSGAFDGIDFVESNKVGFNQSTMKSSEIDTKTLQKYGIIPELLGRLPVIAKLEPLTAADLKNILTKPKNSLTSQYQRLLKISNINVEFASDALDLIAYFASKDQIGARGLRKSMEDIMLDYMFNIDKYKNKTIKIDKGTVEKFFPSQS